MNQEEYFEMLRQGVDHWNEWRAQHPEVRPCLNTTRLTGINLNGADLSGTDLGGAGLSRADLSGTHLSRADLSEADLRGANLRAANLSGADLSAADLSGAILNGADLSAADLSGTILNGADLSAADLSGAILNGAALKGADVTGAWVGWTHFAKLDLRMVKGLETLNHRGPSTIGIDTLYCSEGQIPESFLHRAGVPDNFLTYLPLLVIKAVE